MSKVIVLRRKDGDEKWGEYLDTVLNCVKDVMDGLFQKTARKDVVVEYSENGPVLALEKDMIEREPYTILLSAKELYWCQFIYQFAHEYCHILIGSEKTYFYCADGKYHFMWLEEALCELASLVALQNVYLVWEDRCAFDKYNYKFYLNEYFTDRISLVQKCDDFKTWFANNYKLLSRDYITEYENNISVDDSVRLRGRVVAHALLPYTRHPKFWVLIGKLEEIQPFLESDKICMLLQALSAVVEGEPALVDCLKNIQDTLSTT